MSWLSDAWDAGKTFIGDNKDWLKPVAAFGVDALKQTQSDDLNSQYIDYLRNRENQNYENAKAQADAYNQQLAASGAASSARAAAARQNESNRLAAAKKANKVTQDTYKKILAMYAPYKQTADALLPQMTKTYQDSLALQGDMLGFVQSPEQQAKLNAAGPAWNVNVPLPDYVKMK